MGEDILRMHNKQKKNPNNIIEIDLEKDLCFLPEFTLQPETTKNIGQYT